MSPLRQVAQRGRAFWSGLQARQKKVVAAGAAILAVTFAYLWVIDPWLALQRRLDSSLPSLRTELAQMQKMAAEVNALNTNPKPPKAGASLATVQQALAALPASGPVLRDDGPSRLLLNVASVRFNDLMAWLANLQTTQGLRVATASIARLDATGGLVKAELVLESPETQ